ncbi:MAG TPA: phage head closure protein [Devosia sp.]|jgi:SPP1 family predicted phage head-tail adaptor|nr:phage head closure protein [Devosia sp.]
MRAGPLNRFCSIIREGEIGRDDFNMPIYGDTTVAQFWAALVPKSEEERFAASQIFASQVVTFRTHFVDGLAETDRLECDGKTYNIVGLREIGYRAGTEITAKTST